MRGITEERLKELLLIYPEINIDYLISEECNELNPWQPISTVPKGQPGFLALSNDRDAIEWMLDDESSEDKFFNVNSGNYTEKRHWSHWQELPEDPK